MQIELSAIRTLDKLGYTYHGGELWKPPIGEKPTFTQPAEVNRVHEKAGRIYEISKYFDFKKVAEVMQYLGWQWWDIGVPTEEEIRSFCLSAVTDVYNKTCATMTSHSYNSGGFFVQSHIEDDTTISISVKFILTELDAFTPE